MLCDVKEQLLCSMCCCMLEFYHKFYIYYDFVFTINYIESYNYGQMLTADDANVYIITVVKQNMLKNNSNSIME